jgi:hypothetical protein
MGGKERDPGEPDFKHEAERQGDPSNSITWLQITVVQLELVA